MACACRLALKKTTGNTKFYNISGAEVLSYREMVRRVFIMLGKKPFFIPIPIWIFKLGVWLLKIVPRYRKWNPEMAERMNADLVFDHTLAAVDLGFKPQRFQLNPLEFSREPVKSRLF